MLDYLKDKHPIVPLILDYRTVTKLKSTYVDGFMKLIGEDGRIHSSFNQTETRTGRISSTEPNMQNIPVRTELGSNLRRFFKARPGYLLVDADYSQIDLAPQNQRVYYGLSKTEQSSEKCLNITHDAKVCPRCFGRMSYTYYHYNHIGGFQCSKCGYINPQWSYASDNVDFSSGDFTINGCRVHTDYKDQFIQPVPLQ